MLETPAPVRPTGKEREAINRDYIRNRCEKKHTAAGSPPRCAFFIVFCEFSWPGRAYMYGKGYRNRGHSTREIPGHCARNAVDDLRISPIVTPPSPQVSGTGRNKLHPGLFCQTLDRQRIPWYTYYKNTAAEDLLLGRKRIVRLPENFRRRREGL